MTASERRQTRAVRVKARQMPRKALVMAFLLDDSEDIEAAVSGYTDADDEMPEEF